MLETPWYTPSTASGSMDKLGEDFDISSKIKAAFREVTENERTEKRE